MNGAQSLVLTMGFWVALAALAASGGLVARAVTALVPRLERTAPPVRETVLLALAAAPWALAMLALGSVFLPSVLDWGGVTVDHCLSHGGQHAHLCFQHASHPLLASGGVLAGLAFGTCVGLSLAIFAWYRRCADATLELNDLADPGDDPHRWWIRSDQPIALTTGLLQPRILVSTGLVEALTPEDLAVVLAHEEAHRSRRDGIRKVLIAAFTSPFPKPTRRWLREAYELTCEHIADTTAASQVGCPAKVARALLAVERLHQGRQIAAPALALAFHGGAIERRVNALLEPDWSARPRDWAADFLATTSAAAGLACLFAHPWHEAIEAVFAQLV